MNTAIRKAIDTLNQATMRLAELMMDSAVSSALTGKTFSNSKRILAARSLIKAKRGNTTHSLLVRIGKIKASHTAAEGRDEAG